MNRRSIIYFFKKALEMDWSHPELLLKQAGGGYLKEERAHAYQGWAGEEVKKVVWTAYNTN